MNMHIHTHTQIHVHVRLRLRVRVRVGGEGEGRGVVVGWSVGGWVGECVLVRVCVLCVLIPFAVSLRMKMGLNSFIR